jgi:mannose-6-phosphate isomerase-like protein (cupin superfamily)
MLATARLNESADTLAPDGAEVRMLCATGRGSMAHFRLPPGAVSRAVAHRTVEEVWYVLAGTGRLWRRVADTAAVTALTAGVSATIPLGAQFQFRNDGSGPLDILAVTMPPWPGMAEAYPVVGPWSPTA